MTDDIKGLVSPGAPAPPANTTTMSSKNSAQRMPPPEKPETIKTRSMVIAAFWCIIVLFGFPIWWQTTSIYRAKLPIEAMVDWANGKVSLANLNH